MPGSQVGATRNAPYASPSAFRDFLTRTKPLPPPERVDRNFLLKLGVAPNNEWALLSALKYLGIVDDRGVPTERYAELQGERWQDVLREMVESAYRPLIDVGGATMGPEDLRNYFRVTSSRSQAQNAARFFRELRDLAGLGGAASRKPYRARPEAAETAPQPAATQDAGTQLRLQAKLAALQLMPQRPPDWSAQEYLQLFERLLEILRNLDETR